MSDIIETDVSLRDQRRSGHLKVLEVTLHQTVAFIAAFRKDRCGVFVWISVVELGVMKRSFVIKCSPYPNEVLVCVGMDDKEVGKRVRRWGEDMDDETIKNASVNSVLYNTGSNGIVLRLNKVNKDPFYLGILAHEIFHVVKRIMMSVDIPLSGNSEEAWAYLISFLNEEILKRYHKRSGR